MEQKVKNIILNEAVRRNQIIYGATAINRQLPEYLRKETEDIDIITKNPKKHATDIANSLNKELGYEKYKIIPAKHKGTWKVKDIETNKTIADYTGKIGKKPNTINVLGNKYADLNSIQRTIKKTLKDEANAFRFDKDFDTLKRIKEGTKPIW